MRVARQAYLVVCLDVELDLLASEGSYSVWRDALALILSHTPSRNQRT
jgi:hypothetical protein